jgi:hypothetical protein
MFSSLVKVLKISLVYNQRSLHRASILHQNEQCDGLKCGLDEEGRKTSVYIIVLSQGREYKGGEF